MSDNGQIFKDIIIIDDDPSVLHAIERQLKNTDYKLETCSDPIIALEKIKELKYDLIICDIKMKPISGLDIFNEVKLMENKIPFIFITGFSDLYHVDKMRDMGIDDFLVKPIRKNILINSINKVFELNES